MTNYLKTLLTIIITGAVVGGGVYYAITSTVTKDKIIPQVIEKVVAPTVSDPTKDWDTFNGSFNTPELDGTHKQYSFKYPKGFTIKEWVGNFHYEILNENNELILGVEVKPMGCEGSEEECAFFDEFLQSLTYIESSNGTWGLSVRPEKPDIESKKITNQIIASFVLQN